MRRKALAARLHDDFDADQWGYGQLADLEDEIQRAVVSDQIRGAVDGACDNLIEARLHELDLREVVGPNGLAMIAPGRPFASS
jgi:hypothetical protein